MCILIFESYATVKFVLMFQKLKLHEANNTQLYLSLQLPKYFSIHGILAKLKQIGLKKTLKFQK